jgi:TPR repeat protein
MRRLAFSALLIAGFHLNSGATAVAGPFEEGAAASQRGDSQTALKLWRPLAEQGNASAQFNIGLMYKLGKGTSKDIDEAVKWFDRAARQGNVLAQINLGIAYEQGEGVPQNYLLAYVWYDVASSAVASVGAASSFVSGLGRIEKEIEAKLGPAKLAEAKAIAQKCTASRFKQCQ